jgi:hypothetical protein
MAAQQVTAHGGDPLGRLREAIAHYQRHPQDAQAIARLRDWRDRLAQQWLAARDRDLEHLHTSGAGAAQKLLMQSGLRYEPLTATEQAQLQQWVPRIAAGLETPGAIAALLATQLYLRADQLPLHYAGQRVPRWFVQALLDYLLDFPCFVRDRGEMERYANFAIALIEYLHSQVMAHPGDEFWRDVAIAYVNASNPVPLYFTERNLLPVMRQRAGLFETALRSLGHPLEWTPPPRPPRAKIRLGILKASYISHPETFTTFPVFEYLDRDRFEVILYTLATEPDLLERYHAQYPGDQIVRLTGELADQVNAIRADDLDVLLVGSIVTNSIHRMLLIAAHRLARVQIHSVSSPVTTGLRHIDYYLSGTLTEAPTAASHYSEKLLLVEGPAHCFDYALEAATPRVAMTRADLGLAPGAIAFTSGANLYKVIPELRHTWAKILAAVPNAVLILYPFGASWRSFYPKVAFWQSLRDTLGSYGVDRDRLILLDALPTRADVKVCLGLADIYLDSFPFAGANSMVDALEAGLPPVAREGEGFRSRQGAALIRDLGLPELITHSETAYLELAVRLASDRPYRLKLQTQIQAAIAAGPRFLNSRAYAAEVDRLCTAALADWERSRREPINSVTL